MLSSEKTVLSLRGVVQVKASQGADVGLQVQGGEKCDVAIRHWEVISRTGKFTSKFLEAGGDCDLGSQRNRLARRRMRAWELGENGRIRLCGASWGKSLQ